MNRLVKETVLAAVQVALVRNMRRFVRPVLVLVCLGYLVVFIAFLNYTYKTNRDTSNPTSFVVKSTPSFSKLERLIASNQSDALNLEVVRILQYWKRIDSSSLKRVHWSSEQNSKFLTFEPDSGGFNNIRMNFETILAMAWVLNRTLVLPPRMQLYLLHKPSELTDYFDPVDLLNNPFLNVITMDQFLERRSLNLSYPKTDYVKYSEFIPLFDWFRTHSCSPTWDMHAKCLNALEGSEDAVPSSDLAGFELKAFCQKRRVVDFKPCLDSEIIHFPSNKHGNVRLFGNWFTFIHFSNHELFVHTALFLKRYVHYRPDIVQVAARIVTELLMESQGHYYAIHARFGDFQFSRARVPPAIVINRVAPLFPEKNRIVYISTDEKNQTRLAPFQQAFKVRMLSDYKHIIGSHERRIYGMIEQLVCSFAQVFVGAESSTFSAYITRLRFFLSKEIPIDSQIYLSTIDYTLEKNLNRTFASDNWINGKWHGALWSREFDFAWV